MTVSPATAAPAMDKAHADLKKTTEQFESFFLHQMLQEMRKTVPKDTLLGDDAHQQEIFQDMLDQKLSDSISQRGDFGLGKMMYSQLAPSLGKTSGAAVDTAR